jgi:hypothetical protein
MRIKLFILFFINSAICKSNTTGVMNIYSFNTKISFLGFKKTFLSDNSDFMAKFNEKDSVYVPKDMNDIIQTIELLQMEIDNAIESKIYYSTSYYLYMKEFNKDILPENYASLLIRELFSIREKLISKGFVYRLDIEMVQNLINLKKSEVLFNDSWYLDMHGLELTMAYCKILIENSTVFKDSIIVANGLYYEVYPYEVMYDMYTIIEIDTKISQQLLLDLNKVKKVYNSKDAEYFYKLNEMNALNEIILLAFYEN